MTIGYITQNYPPSTEGGAEISLFYLANSLAKKGVKVRIFVPSPEYKENVIQGDNPKIYRFHWSNKRPFFLNNPLAQRRFKMSILGTKEKLDIIDGYNFITTLPNVSYDLGIPFVVGIRDATPLCDVRCELHPKYHPFFDYFKLRFGYLGATPIQAIYGIFGYFLTQKRLNVIRKANCVAFASQALADLFKEYNPNREVVYSVAPEIKSVKKTINIKGIDFSKDKVFLYAGRLSYGKGSKFLFEIAESIAKERKDIKFIFAGKGEYLGLFKKTSFSDSIYAIGKIPNEELFSLISQVRATVVPSIIFEPFPRIALESLACNTPVIGTDSGGIPEAVGNAGIIAKIDKYAVKKAIIKLADDNGLHKELKSRSLNQVKKFNKDKITNNMLSIYERILK